MKNPKGKAIELLDRINPHAQYWDGYNDCPLEYDHTAKLAHIVVDEIISTVTEDLDKRYWLLVKHYIN